jgi:hypothetical protein
MTNKNSSLKREYIMNYLLEDIFRRADTWQGMSQKDRVFLDPQRTVGQCRDAFGSSHRDRF